MADKKTYIHPSYNNGYSRYDLDMDDVIDGLRKKGYDLDHLGESEEDDEYNKALFRLEVHSTNGTVANTSSFSTILYPTLYKDDIDITDETPASCFKWIRISGNSEAAKKEDAEWNLRFASGTKECEVTKSDFQRHCVFQCRFVKSVSEDITYVQQAYKKYLNGGDD